MAGPWQFMPGVNAAGHVTGGGFWHPGAIDGCVKCPQPRFPHLVDANWRDDRR